MAIIVTAEQAYREVNKKAGKPSFFLDIDGTLIDIAPTPDEVIIPHDLEETLMGLSRHFNVAVITGRDIDFVDKTFPNLKPACSTSHGAIIRYNHRGNVEQIVPEIDIRKLELAISNELNVLDSQGSKGTMIEVKQFSCALHWRQSALDETAANTIFSTIGKRAMNTFNEGMSESDHVALTLGDKVVEIGPHAATKGEVIEKFLKTEPFDNTVPVFLEDSFGGITGIEVVNRQQNGLTFCVGPALKEHAQFQLANPTEARKLLKHFIPG